MFSLHFRGSRLSIQMGQETVKLNDSYEPAKAAQIIAYFALRQGDGGIDLLKAMKLVYLSDRESIKRTGEPILNERRASLEHGPVNTLTYAFANGKHCDAEGWSRFLKDRDENNLEVVPGIDYDDLDRLSEEDFDVLDAVWDEFGFMWPMVLRSWTHKPSNVPEWRDPGKSAFDISLEDMMAAVGIENPKEAARAFENRRSLNSLLEKP